MSTRLGQPFILQAASAAIGAGFARLVTVPQNPPGTPAGPANSLDQGQWACLVAVFATFTASGNAGSRQLSLLIKDAAGNILWQALQGTAVTTGQVVNIIAGGGSGPAAVTGPPITQTLQLPCDFPVPPGGTIAIAATGFQDATDTCLVNAVLSL